MLRRAVWQNFTDVSEVLAASITKAIALHGATSQNTFI
jgi:hypothetical protein